MSNVPIGEDYSEQDTSLLTSQYQPDCDHRDFRARRLQRGANKRDSTAQPNRPLSAPVVPTV